jgi:hypothetical protein
VDITNDVLAKLDAEESEEQAKAEEEIQTEN